jgi:hypothetical protein
MAIEKICYYCGERATTREHVPPKGFFSRKANLQLKTVPSCTKHNNAKSHDDQYLLAQICTWRGRQLTEKDLPQFDQAPT